MPKLYYVLYYHWKVIAVFEEDKAKSFQMKKSTWGEGKHYFFNYATSRLYREYRKWIEGKRHSIPKFLVKGRTYHYTDSYWGKKIGEL